MRSKAIVLFCLTGLLAGVQFVLFLYAFEVWQLLDWLHVELHTLWWIGGGMVLLAGLGAYLFSAWLARFVVGISVIKQPTTYLEKWLFTTIAAQARQLGIPPPQIGVFYSADMNAFTTGWGSHHAMLAVSSGLLENLRQHELEAVIGHELVHIKNGDMVSLAMAQGVLFVLSILPARILGGAIDRLLLRNDSRQGPTYTLVYWLLMAIVGLAPYLLVMWFSRQREFTADSTSALLNGHQNMISALQSLSLNFNPSFSAEQLAAFGIAGSMHTGVLNIFLSHPPLARRIAMIQQQAQLLAAHERHEHLQ